MVFSGWFQGHDQDSMRDPYLLWNELFHPLGAPDKVTIAMERITYPDLYPLHERVPSSVRMARVRAQRVRSFEIACAIVATELTTARAQSGLG